MNSSSQFKDDAVLMEYLDDVEQYQIQKNSASDHWKNAFINLSKAKLSDPTTTLPDYNSDSPASLVCENLVIVPKETLNKEGSWSPAALTQAKAAFISALKSELESLKIVKDKRLDTV